MPDFLRVLAAIRQPDVAVYQAGRTLNNLSLRLYGARAERRRDLARGSQLADRQVSHFRDARPPFFVPPSRMVNCRVGARLVHQADMVGRHEFQFHGSEKVNLGTQIDWQRDPKSGYRWPDDFSIDLDVNTADSADDHWVRELSRFQYLPCLAFAHRTTGDGRYATSASDLLTHWIEHNAVYRGPNWVYAMDAAVRACNWLFWWQCLDNRAEFDEVFIRRFYASLLTHGRFVARNLERHPARTNTHYLANLAGLAYLGLLLPEDSETREWAVLAHDELEKQIWRQILPDGAHFEASIPYHRLALELIAYPALIFRLNGFDLSYEFWRHLERGFEFVAGYLTEGGLAPQIGDNNNGRLHTVAEPFGWAVNDHRYLLDIASSLFPENQSFSGYGDTTEEARYFTGWSTVDSTSVKKKTESSSEAFPDTGIFVMRGERVHCLADCGPTGRHGTGGHAHNDTLSFTFSLGTHRMIVDPGTGSYARSEHVRNLFRSTAVHNTARVGGIEMNDLPKHEMFRLAYQDKPKVLSWSTNEHTDRLAACHYGYTKLSPPVVHMRTLELAKSSDQLTVVDRFLTNGGHAVEWNIPLAPQAICSLQDQQSATIVVEDAKIRITWNWQPDRVELVATRYSEAYGTITENQTLRLTTNRSDDRSYSWSISVLSA